MLSSKDSLAVLKKTRALLEGHFVLSSGLHSSKYVQCAKLLSKPSLASKICLSLAKNGFDIAVNYNSSKKEAEETVLLIKKLKEDLKNLNF